MNDTVTTAKAAAMWGVSPGRFLQIMREYGVAPLQRERADGRGGLEYHWIPGVVLQVRAAYGQVRRARNEARRVAEEARSRPPRQRLAAGLFRRHVEPAVFVAQEDR